MVARIGGVSWAGACPGRRAEGGPRGTERSRAGRCAAATPDAGGAAALWALSCQWYLARTHEVLVRSAQVGVVPLAPPTGPLLVVGAARPGVAFSQRCPRRWPSLPRADYG